MKQLFQENDLTWKGLRFNLIPIRRQEIRNILNTGSVLRQCQGWSDSQPHPFKTEWDRRATMSSYQITSLLPLLQSDNSLKRLPITVVMDGGQMAVTWETCPYPYLMGPRHILLNQSLLRRRWWIIGNVVVTGDAVEILRRHTCCCLKQTVLTAGGLPCNHTSWGNVGEMRETIPGSHFL
jgi:hypothetical protein